LPFKCNLQRYTADDDEREELLRSTEKKCAELHALVMKLKHEATAGLRTRGM
jgi:hypothetical protein